MEVTLVKAAWPGDRDRAWLTVAGVTRRGPVHVVHDLPHLAVESLFGIDDGLWAELAAGDHAVAGHAATARDPKRQKRGRIVSGAATGARTGEWLTPGTAGPRRSQTAWPTGGVMAQTPRPGSATGPPGRTTRHCKTCWPGSMTRPSPWPSGASGTWSNAGWRCRLAGRSGCAGR